MNTVYEDEWGWNYSDDPMVDAMYKVRTEERLRRMIADEYERLNGGGSVSENASQAGAANGGCLRDEATGTASGEYSEVPSETPAVGQ